MQKKQVIISMTSFPEAIPYAEQAIRSLLRGSVLPDKLVLYLTFSQFLNNKLPETLLSLSSENNTIFEIRNYDIDIRSYRKLIPALTDFPEAVIVTVDDDVVYDKHMLRDLLELHSQIPDAILAHRAKHIKIGKPYRGWKKYRWYHFLFTRIHRSFLNIQTGVGGVLYPPHSLRSDMMNIESFTKIAPYTDDIWFWAAGVANGFPVIPFPFGRYNKPRGLHKPKNLSLKTMNFKGKTDRNVAALKEIMAHYPVISQILCLLDRKNQKTLKPIIKCTAPMLSAKPLVAKLLTPDPSIPRIVVSMTTFPKAIPYAVHAIQSILDGFVLPDKMVCYLNLSEFDEGGIPAALKHISELYPIFEIRTCDMNIRSYLKLIPALKDFPESIIVTVDDDIAYHRHMLGDLLRMHFKIPNAIIAHRVRRISKEKPYCCWKKYHWYDFLFKKIHRSFDNLQTGVGGVLYPPHSLKNDMLDPKIFMKLGSTTDDIWFWAAAVANRTPVIPVPFGYNKPRELNKPRDISLMTKNYKGGTDRNVATLTAIIEHYPELRDLINYKV